MSRSWPSPHWGNWCGISRIFPRYTHLLSNALLEPRSSNTHTNSFWGVSVTASVPPVWVRPDCVLGHKALKPPSPNFRTVTTRLAMDDINNTPRPTQDGKEVEAQMYQAWSDPAVALDAKFLYLPIHTNGGIDAWCILTQHGKYSNNRGKKIRKLSRAGDLRCMGNSYGVSLFTADCASPRTLFKIVSFCLKNPNVIVSIPTGIKHRISWM
jgi:hypothetical protein